MEQILPRLLAPGLSRADRFFASPVGRARSSVPQHSVTHQKRKEHKSSMDERTRNVFQGGRKFLRERQNASVFLGSDCILSPSAKSLATLEIFEGK